MKLAPTDPKAAQVQGSLPALRRDAAEVTAVGSRLEAQGLGLKVFLEP